MSSRRAKLVISQAESGMFTAELISNNNESILKLGEYATKDSLKRGIKTAKMLFQNPIIIDEVIDFKEEEVEEIVGEAVVISEEFDAEEAAVEAAMAKEGLVAQVVNALKSNKDNKKKKK